MAAGGHSLGAGSARGADLPALREFAEWAGLGWLVTVTALVIYFDDIQIRNGMVQDAPTIFNLRIAGLKVVDLLSISLLLASLACATLRGSVAWTPVHRNMLLMLGVYCYAGVTGFVYGFFFRYDYEVWLQDFQPMIYFFGWFLIVFHLLDTRQKWRIYAVAFLALLAAKNYLIVWQTLGGVGKAIGDWAFRASQNAEFTYFPMLFFALVVLLAGPNRRFGTKMILAATALGYLVVALVGIYRTVWVMLIIGTFYLLFRLDPAGRLKIVVAGAVSIVLSVLVISLMFPRFIDLAFGYKFMSIFEWSLAGDRSNATRMLEVINVIHRLFATGAFLQGMGLGAWWDDSARRLLQDYGSGFTFKWRYTTTHIWILTQLLKLGLVGTAVYWLGFIRIFRYCSRGLGGATLSGWESRVALGLLVGLLCTVVSSANFVRMFLVMGINVALLTSHRRLFNDRSGAGAAAAP